MRATGKTKTSAPVGLYFHIPFCSKKCPYCHFYVIPDRKEHKDMLLVGLQHEWDLMLPKVQDKQVQSVYFGGGTPFLFGVEAIGTVLSWIKRASECEITLEVNPEHVTYDALKAYAEVGINRISLGVQSLDNSLLKVLGRNHTAGQALEAIETTLQAGISNISIDLMYDLPHQTLASWKTTLSQLRDLPITHLSLYNLTIEPHTAFFKQQNTLAKHLPDPDLSLALLEKAVSTLTEMGFARYEISAFSRPGFEAVHNSGYWKGRPFLGYGPSAFSYWEGKRFRNVANLSTYCARLQEHLSPVDFEEALPYPANVRELFAIRLRLLEGVNLSEYALPQESLDILERLVCEGLIEMDRSQAPSTRARLTDRGLLFYDSVASHLI